MDVPILRGVVWMGDAKNNLREFPEGARKLIGDELQLIQFGGMPRDTKSFKGIGSGVLEIAVRYDKDAYRTVCGSAAWKETLRPARFSKEIETGYRDAEAGY